MNKNSSKLIGVLYKHGENDMSVWFPDLTEAENAEIQALLVKFTGSGCSVRGTKQDVIAEIEETIN